MTQPLNIIVRNISWDVEDLDPSAAEALPSEVVLSWDDMSGAVQEAARTALLENINMDLAGVIAAYAAEAITERFNCCHFGADVTTT